MRKLNILLLGTLLWTACNSVKKGNEFVVTGNIENSPGGMIYLEKISAAAMDPILEDSTALTKEGNFTLKTESGEAVIYNIRIGKSQFPIASVLNDTDKVNLNIKLSNKDNQFAEKYDVQGSPATTRMKDFMVRFNNDLQQIFILSRNEDSLKNTHVADSVLLPIREQKARIAADTRKYTLNAIEEAKNPALVMFELGYYQSTTASSGFGLEPFSDDEVSSIVSKTAAAFPEHTAVAAVKAQLDNEARKLSASSWVGKEAPDFSLPDINGKEIKLSSFRGKYVLVDFWASWCGPCRAENPNLVKAFATFKDKNFTILGVSLDKPGEKERWMKAVKDDQLKWTQVSDLQYWYSPVVNLYHFDGIPYNVLVDPQGKVIAEKLRGQNLENKLKEVLQ